MIILDISEKIVINKVIDVVLIKIKSLRMFTCVKRYLWVNITELIKLHNNIVLHKR